MDLFVIFRRGVYRQQCGGVFSELEMAVAAARFFISVEPDDYHVFEIYQFHLNVQAHHVPGTYQYKAAGRLYESPPIKILRREKDTIYIDDTPGQSIAEGEGYEDTMHG